MWCTGDEQWFIDQAAEAQVTITHVIDTHVHADHYSGGRMHAQLAGAHYCLHESDADFVKVEDGARLADPKLGADNPCHALLHELLDVGLNVQVCGNTMKKIGWGEVYLLPGIQRGSMKALSAFMSAADEIITS